MTAQAALKIFVGSKPLINSGKWEQEKLSLPIPIRCPYCDALYADIGGWGSYETRTGEVRRFMCTKCQKTFNPAKIPYWVDKITDLVWKLAQLTIEDQVTVNGLAQKFNVPETTLRRLVVEIRSFLSDNYEFAKQLQEGLSAQKPPLLAPLRVIFYDEGFLKLLGATGFLIFTLNANGTPLTINIEPQRDGETIYTHFLQAITQLGGVDVIIGDGANTIAAATKALRQPVLLIQQLHSGKAKKAWLVKYEPIPNRKAVWETRIELHSGSLLPEIESELTVKKQKVYPPKYSPYKKTKSPNRCRPRLKLKAETRMSTFTPVEGIITRKSFKISRPKLLKGHRVFLRTGKKLSEYELNFIPNKADYKAQDCPSLTELQAMLSLAQAALPYQFITSNRAEVFNALYDRTNHAWGVSTIKQANENARAWAVMKFYPLGAKILIQRHKWHIPYRLVKMLGFLMISKIEVD